MRREVGADLAAFIEERVAGAAEAAVQLVAVVRVARAGGEGLVEFGDLRGHLRGGRVQAEVGPQLPYLMMLREALRDIAGDQRGVDLACFHGVDELPGPALAAGQEHERGRAAFA